jgi:hypothetical protein
MAYSRMSDADNGYYAEWYPTADASDNDTNLYKVVAGTRTQLATVDTGLANGDVFKLQMRDASKKLFKNGVQLLSSSDNTHTSAGEAGISAGKYNANAVGNMNSTWRFDDYGVIEADTSNFYANVGDISTGTGAATSTIAIAGLGFQPKLVLLWWNGRTDLVNTVGRRTHQRGFGAATSSSNRACIASLSQDTPTNMVTNHVLRTDACIEITTTGDAIDGLMDLSSMDSDGFTLVVDDAFTASYRVQYLALGGSDITNVTVGTFAKATGTGDQDITTVGFQPDCVIFFGTQQTTSDGTIAVDSTMFVGAATGASNQAVWAGGSNDAAGTSQTLAYCKAGECIAQFDAAVTVINDRAAFVSFLSNGFRINWTENTGATAHIVGYVAIKGGKYFVGDLLTQTDTTTNIVESGFGFSPKAALLVSAARSQSTADTPTDDDFWSMGALSNTLLR